MLTNLEGLVTKCPCRIENGIPVFHTPVAKRQSRLALGNIFPIQINSALIGNGHDTYSFEKAPDTRCAGGSVRSKITTIIQ